MAEREGRARAREKFKKELINLKIQAAERRELEKLRGGRRGSVLGKISGLGDTFGQIRSFAGEVSQRSKPAVEMFSGGGLGGDLDVDLSELEKKARRLV